MHVLVVSHTYTAPINRAKLEALAYHCSLTAIIPYRWQDSLFAVDSSPNKSNYALHALPIRFNGHILRHLYPSRALNQILRSTQPDLVYVEEEPGSLALAQFTFKRDYKLVFFTWENVFRRLCPLALERWNLARSDGAICGNHDAARNLSSKNFLKPIAVTPQIGVDPDLFHPERSRHTRSSLGLDGFVVGYIGRLVEEKGLWTLLAAIERVPDVRLVIVGAGPLREGIERWITRHRLASHTRLVTSVPHEEIPRYLNALDTLVLPSQTTPRWKEQFGHVLIEAMACGVPVIGSDCGAIPEVIADAGIIFPEGNVGSLRDAIVALQSNPRRRTQLADAGRARVLAHYTHTHIAAQNLEFFQQVLSQ